MKTLEQRQWRPTGVFIVNCELISRTGKRLLGLY